MKAISAQLTSVSLLGLICLFAIGREFDAVLTMAPYAGLALMFWASIEWRKFATVAKITFSAGLLLGAVFYMRGGLTDDVLAKAIGRSAFFTLFLISMDILRTAAMTSRLVLESGRAIVNQPPGRRYVVITLGGHLFATLLNLGAINLLGTMNRRSIENESDPKIKDIRLQRMTLALIRGFASFTMWAPTAVTVLVILAAIPELEYYQFAPVGAATAASFMAFGWLLDRLSFPRRNPANSPQPLSQVLLALLPMVLLTLAILLLAIILSQLTGIRLIAALLICVPICGVAWIAVQYSRAGAKRAFLLTKRRLIKRVLPDLTTLRSEIAILSSAGFIAVILPNQIDTVSLGHFIAGLGLTESWLLILMIWTVVLLGPIGLNPIISVSVSVEILAQLSGFSFNPYTLAFAGIIAWGLTTGCSPLGATIRISGRSIDRPAAEVGLVWNRPFTIYMLLASSLILILIS